VCGCVCLCVCVVVWLWVSWWGGSSDQQHSVLDNIILYISIVASAYRLTFTLAIRINGLFVLVSTNIKEGLCISVDVNKTSLLTSM
jgi:hypothetical protein